VDKLYIGIDNGTSGTIASLCSDGNSSFIQTPIKIEQSYTKTKANISRIDFPKLLDYLETLIKDKQVMHVLIERPGINPGRFKTTLSAMRSLEATLIVLELLNLPFSYLDSKEWQKELLPSGIKGEELKKASLDIGCRLFPIHSDLIKKHKDADSLLIAEYCRRKFK
jgi:hypothetical protein